MGNVPGIGKVKDKKSNKNKKVKKQVLDLDSDKESEILKETDNLFIENTTKHQEVKKSYSSVIKSNLLKQSDTNFTISSHPKPEPVPISSPLPTRSQSLADQSILEQDSGTWQ